MMTQMAGVVNRSRTVNGVPTSLADLGYKDVGLDDNCAYCNSCACCGACLPPCACA